MAGRKRRYRSKSGLCTVLVALVVAFCVLSTLQDRYGYAFGLPTVDLPSVSGLWENLEPEGESNSHMDNAVAVQGEVTNAGLTVHILDMGQADSILIRGADCDVLIDAGENGQGKDVLRYLEEQGISELDLVIGTHPHSDHVGGMDTVLQGIAVKEIMLPELADEIIPTTRTYTDLLMAIAEEGVALTVAEPGLQFKLGDGAVLTVLAPRAQYTDLNNMSVVSRVTYGDTAFLFTGDASAESEADLLAADIDLHCDVLDLGHHGSSTASTMEFLQAVSPRIATISCGLDNSYGHPHREVMERLTQMNVQIARTDRNGVIVITSDGKQIGVQTQR